MNSSFSSDSRLTSTFSARLCLAALVDDGVTFIFMFSVVTSMFNDVLELPAANGVDPLDALPRPFILFAALVTVGWSPAESCS